MADAKLGPSSGFDTMKSAFEKTSTDVTDFYQDVSNNNRSYIRYGGYALIAFGGYMLWKNRFRIQQFIESKGVNTPLMNGSVSETIRSGVAKVSGSLSDTLNKDTAKTA